jgi:hypothetical protein
MRAPLFISVSSPPGDRIDSNLNFGSWRGADFESLLLMAAGPGGSQSVFAHQLRLILRVPLPPRLILIIKDLLLLSCIISDQ